MKKILVFSFLIWFGINIGNCKSIQHGVVKEKNKDGTIDITVTGLASQNAIEKDSIAMKQTTSRSAAELTLMAEVKNTLEPNDSKQNHRMLLKKHFKESDSYHLDRGKYFRIEGVIYPDGIPSDK